MIRLAAIYCGNFKLSKCILGYARCYGPEETLRVDYCSQTIGDYGKATIMIQAVTFMDPKEGRTRMLIKPSHHLGRVIDIVCNFDPVLELEDGTVIRVFQGGSHQEHLSIRVTAEAVIQKHDKVRSMYRYMP